MSTRRRFLLGLGSFAGGILSVRADELCAAFNKDAQAGITSDQALDRLTAGNARFLAGHPLHCNLQSQVKATAGGQAPFAAVLGCMDSRAAPELVFDQRIGDIFAVRIAGNFVNTDILGSLEYATHVAGAKAHPRAGAFRLRRRTGRHRSRTTREFDRGAREYPSSSLRNTRRRRIARLEKQKIRATGQRTQRSGRRLAAHEPQQNNGGPRQRAQAPYRRRHARREHRRGSLAGQPVRLSVAVMYNHLLANAEVRSIE
jgi:carbonic anhydrase